VINIRSAARSVLSLFAIRTVADLPPRRFVRSVTRHAAEVNKKDLSSERVVAIVFGVIGGALAALTIPTFRY
jgi:hypothetical protein